jgi:hypothetical protein
MAGTQTAIPGRRLMPVGGGGAVVPPGLGNISRNAFFQYSQRFVFVGNETQQQTIQIQADSHFLCMATLYDTNSLVVAPFAVGTGAQFGGSLVQLTDVAGQRLLSNNPLPASTLFGSAQRPFVWPFSHLFRANGGITLSVTGINAASAQTMHYVFAGFKLPIGSVPELGI